MPTEQPEAELARLKKEQEKARKDEIFGGLSVSERQEYDARHRRIKALQASVIELSDVGDARQQFAWAQTSETDTHQREAHQSYRSGEQDSSEAYTDSKAESREVKRRKADTE